MPPHPAFMTAPAHRVVDLGRRVVTWPVSSQQGSRRNAMIAATDIRRRRSEQREVEEFLATRRPRRRAATG